MRLHDGDVWVQDTPGGGATFTVDIPVREGPAPKLSMSGDAGKTDASALHTEPKAVKVSKPVALVVDDNHDLLDFMRDELSDDFNVITAGDGVEAQQYLIVERFGHIIVGTSGKTFDHRLNVLLGGDKYDRQPGCSLVGLHTAAQFYTVHMRHHEVAHDNVDFFVMQQLESFHPVAGGNDIEDKAVKYVEENLSRSDLSVEELSRQLGMSRVHLYKKMLQLTGKTPIEFIRLLRLKRAAQYLRESQLIKKTLNTC